MSQFKFKLIKHSDLLAFNIYYIYVPMVPGGDEKLLRSFALLRWEGCPYPTSWCRKVEVSVDGRTLQPLVLMSRKVPRVDV